MKHGVILVGLSIITLSFCLIFYPPVTEKLIRHTNKKIENKGGFKPSPANVAAVVLGAALCISGLIFFFEFMNYGMIRYFFKIPIEVTDPLGAFLLYGGEIALGIGWATKNMLSILRDYKTWKNML